MTKEQKLAHAHKVISGHLVEMEELFNQPMRFTFVARDPEGNVENELMVTNDTGPEALAAVARGFKRES